MTEPKRLPDFDTGFWYLVLDEPFGPPTDAEAERRYREKARARRRGRIQLLVAGIIVVLLAIAIATGALGTLLGVIDRATGVVESGPVAGLRPPRG